jgi:hypothetical protein
MTEEGLGKRSLRVRCFVCEKEWFQTTERLLKTDAQHHIQNMTDDKVLEVRKVQQERRFSKADKCGVFVGNLPYTFDEQEITGDINNLYVTIYVSMYICTCMYINMYFMNILLSILYV